MARAGRVRWECPAGKHPGVLGSTRPPRDAVVRYCLPCSEASGRLVERVAPALERKRTARKAAVAERAKTRQQRERERERRKRYVEVVEPDGSIGEVDVLRTLDRMVKLPTMRDRMRETFGYERKRPEVTVRRRGRSGSSGHAKTSWYEMVVTIGERESRAAVEELLLHELVHLVCETSEWHGAAYRRTLVLAAREWWPGITVRADSARRAYDLDRLICEQAREVGKGR